MRVYTILGAMILVMVIYALFFIKNNVQIINYQLSSVTKELVHEQDRIHILKAELAYLSSPSRLRKLSSEYLNLDNIKTTQMIKDPISGDSIQVAKNIQNYKLSDESLRTKECNMHAVKSTVKWRYKHLPHKYIKTVSQKP